MTLSRKAKNLVFRDGWRIFSKRAVVMICMLTSVFFTEQVIPPKVGECYWKEHKESVTAYCIKRY